MELTKTHHVFLQTFMSHGLLVSQEVKKQFKVACEADGKNHEDVSLVDCVQAINKSLAPLHLEIRKAVSEQNGAHSYGLVSTAETEVTKLASLYSDNEYEFIKKIIEAVVESDSGGISSMEALHLTEALNQKMSKKEAQDLLLRLEEDNWILQTAEGQIHLSTRCILDMSLYIQQQFPEAAVDCNLCNKLCIQGQLCDRCDVKLHLPCSARLFNNPDVDPRCPGAACGAPWPHVIPSARDTQVKGSQQPAERRKRKAND